MELNVTNVLILAILLAIVGGIVWYLYRAKKRGQACIGCPYAKQCGKNCACKNAPSNENKNQ